MRCNASISIDKASRQIRPNDLNAARSMSALEKAAAHSRLRFPWTRYYFLFSNTSVAVLRNTSRAAH